MNDKISRLPPRLDGALLLGLALFMAWLVSGNAYWNYLHPRFMPLTAATALVMGGLGVFALIRPPRASAARTLALAVMLALAVVSLPPADPFGPAPDRAAAEEEPVPEDEKGYVRINTGELYDVAENGELKNFPGPGFTVRGFVRRDPALERLGCFGLYRVALYCCFADATAVGFAVRPGDGVMPEDGAWVRILGKLEPAPDGAALPQPEVPGIFYASTLTGYVFSADRVVPVPAPPEPFMFEWRQSEPFAF